MLRNVKRYDYEYEIRDIRNICFNLLSCNIILSVIYEKALNIRTK